MLARPLPGLVIPLAEDLVVSASNGEETVFDLGSVPVRGAVPEDVTVVLHLLRCSGRGTWCPGLSWPDGGGPRWADDERRLAPEAVALPVSSDGDGVDRQVGVLFRLRPLGPSRRCAVVIRAEARFSLAPSLAPEDAEAR